MATVLLQILGLGALWILFGALIARHEVPEVLKRSPAEKRRPPTPLDEPAVARL